ncbi:MAG: cytochrome P450 [Egibacteraceae bacterium]
MTIRTSFGRPASGGPSPPDAAVPPGPAGLRLIGNLDAYERDRLGFLTECARVYGDVVRYSDRVYIVSHPELVEQILVGTNREFLVAFNLLRRESRDDPGAWMRQRRAALQGLGHAAVSAFAGRIAAHADALVDTWRPGDLRPVVADMERLTSAVIAEYCAADQGGRLPARAAALLGALFPVVAGPLRIPPRLPTPANLRVSWALGRLNRELRRLVARNRQQPTGCNDLLGVLLTARPALGDTQACQTLVSVLLASHGVPAAALAWTWYLLARDPDAEQRLHDELDRVLAGRLPAGDDLSALPYATAVVKEALRLYPPTWLAVRRVAAACDLGGYPLRPGQAVLFSSYVLHRDPRWHPQADRFVPQRWLNGTTDGLPRCAYLPFGAGPRYCPGAKLALAELVLATATIGRRVRLCLPARARVRPDARRTLIPHQLHMRVQAR